MARHLYTYILELSEDLKKNPAEILYYCNRKYVKNDRNIVECCDILMKQKAATQCPNSQNTTHTLLVAIDGIKRMIKREKVISKSHIVFYIAQLSIYKCT